MRKKLFLMSIIILLMFPAFSSGVLGGNLSSKEKLAEVNPDHMISPEKAFDWHVKKDKWTPAYSGTPSWHNFMEFVENKLEGYGVVDIAKNKWSYEHWSTSEWPDDSNWEIVSDGENIKVASYGAYSGSTDENGITAELVYYDPTDPPDSIEDKIVVYETKPYPKKPYPKSFLLFCTMNDYEYCTDSETFPELFTPVPVNESISYNVWWQLRQTQKFNKLLVKGNAVGGVIIFDASYERLAGLYTFPVPQRYNVPNVYLARDAGAKVKQDAIKGKKATLKLLANVEEMETYQLIGYLPGKNYGTPDDEQIILVTHTDGCSISQDNGALGILGIIHYFSHFPQKERPKTLMVFLDNRHYMPGMEHAFADEDFFALHPEAWDPIDAGVAVEHLGQIEYKEVDGIFGPTGSVEPSFLWVRDNQKLIDKAIKAVKDNNWPRCMVQAPERKKGTHGGPQGVWYGMGRPRILKQGIPGVGTMGSQGAYWATTAGIEKFDEDLFYTQIASMVQLTGELMANDF